MALFPGDLGGRELRSDLPRSSPILNTFAWSEVEIPEGMQLSSVDVAPDGRVWFGLRRGVAVYDGWDFETYREDSGLGQSSGVCIFATRDGSIYYFEQYAVHRFEEGVWQTIYQGSIHYEAMEIAAEDESGVVWAATLDGLLRIDGADVSIADIKGLALGCVLVDEEGVLWSVALDDGQTFRLPLLDGHLSDSEEWEVLLGSTALQTSRYSLVQDANGSIWRFSTDPSELAGRFDRGSRSWHWHDFEDFGGSNRVQASLVTADGVVWAIADGELHLFAEGIWFAHRTFTSGAEPRRIGAVETSDGSVLLLEPSSRLRLIDYTEMYWGAVDDLRFFAESEEGVKWFIDREGQVMGRSGDDEEDWLVFGMENEIIDSPIDGAVMRDGSIWVTGSHEGKSALSRFHRGVWTRHVYPEFGDCFREDGMVQLPSGEVLLCSVNHFGWQRRPVAGLLRLREDGTSGPNAYLSSDLLHWQILDVATGPDARVWVSQGLHLSRFRDDGWARISPNSEEPAFWKGQIEVDWEGSLWMSNWGSGVARSPDDFEEVTFFNEKDGLGSRFINDIEVDLKRRSIFAIGQEGLNRFDGQKWHLVSRLGAIVSERGESSLRFGSDGTLWVRQASRQWLERGYEADYYRSAPGSSFRSIRYKPEADSPDTTVTMDHAPSAGRGSVSFVWSGKDYWNRTPSNLLQFSYRLDGGAWSGYTSEIRRSFHQLDDGDHSLEVRARDLDFNVDLDPAVIEFWIPPPMWKEWWFIGLLALVVGLVLFLVWVILRQRLQHLVEYDRQRVNFFTSISHELRTPLALILAPLEKVIEQDPDRAKDSNLELAFRSARRLSELVDQLLDFRKVESGNLPLVEGDGDLVSQVEEIVRSFQPLAERKEQSLEFRSLEHSRLVRYDEDKVSKIVSNLISNALKYSPPRGNVRVRLSFQETRFRERGKTRAVVEVEDDGKGIPAARQKQIFEPFYRIDPEESLDASGTGLGLSLVKQLIDALGGTISVSSPPNGDSGGVGHGTLFKASIPVGEVTGEGGTHLNAAREPEEQDGVEPAGDDRQCILLVEDNEDLRRFFASELSKTYRVLSAENGKAGLALAQSTVPDLVIADMMMPEMNGLVFCQKLKEGAATSHIPVVMLTARSSSQFERMGLESGADEYLVKPVSLVALDLRIRNLLGTRTKLQRRLMSRILSEPAAPELDDPEQAFLNRVAGVLNDNLSNPDFGVDEIAEAVGFSRSSFYRKLKAVTGETPNVFIRRFRMQRAGQLLVQSSMTVTEVMFEVGYLDGGYFGKMFKTHFKCSPKEYRNRNQQDGDF
ncbi:hybrid sensor histidine kinase/response regulator transcription factor [Pelagicoccus enzymogenes]|uniref:hybrid sensor histidine kinase/response regulator transcription factor n=1 Tax=Pelagicoccus enzymogenes TaxID=2773457 RepID=UPI0028127702|nr:hybrid sensor histidine kinase/response regulator transcription factor [Pelagicoccus enzymogenes]